MCVYRTLLSQRTVEAKNEVVVVDSQPAWFEALDDFAEKLAAIKVLRRTSSLDVHPTHAASDVSAHV